MLVIDSSATVALLLGRSDVDSSARHIEAHGSRLHAPHLIDIEVLNVLARLDADDALADFLAFPLRRYPHAILGFRIWELRENFSAYDAIYLALAENLAENGGADVQPADGVILLDSHVGDAAATLTNLDPAVVDDARPDSRDPDLDMYSESNGFGSAQRSS